jgi:hypothetical protein
MVRSWYRLWLVLFTSRLCFDYGQATSVERVSSDALPMDQAYLTIINKNYSSIVQLMFNIVACERCDFSPFTGFLWMNTSETKIIYTQYRYEFQLVAIEKNQTLPCSIDHYRFLEHGSYTLEIIQSGLNNSSCSIYQTGESSYYWLPIIVGIALLFSFVIFVQVFQRWYMRRNADRFLNNMSNERLINQDIDTLPISNPTSVRSIPANLNENSSTNDITDRSHSNGELKLVGSTSSLNNSVRISKVLPKRLRALDTFRGFSLMVMIFVNYGGKKLVDKFIQYFLFESLIN